MLEEIFYKIPVINSIVKMQIEHKNFTDFGLTSPVKRNTPIIVSLCLTSSDSENIDITIYSILNQSLKPDKLILWVNQDLYDLATLPYEITRFIQCGLEIRFVKDIGSYTKTIYALKEFKNSVIVTADNFVCYQKRWLEKLYLSYITHPDNIHVHNTHKISLKENRLQLFEDWKKYINIEGSSYNNFIVGTGGVLYPPKAFSNEVLREDIFLTEVPKLDDLWFWIMALIGKRKIRVVKNHNRHIFVTNYFKNNNCSNRDYDNSIENLMKYYSQNIINRLSK